MRSAAGRRLSVFVGAPRGRSRSPGLPLAEAYALARAAPNLVLGGIAIAERHVAKEDEHQRMLAKQDRGCRFFITQSVYDAASTRSLLSDYALSLQACGRSPAPVVLTFSPCGSVRTLEFMKWLGISFPRWLENELRHSADTLERSIDLCERVFTDVQDYAREKQLANRHQRRERLHSKVGDRRVGGALSAIELASRGVAPTGPVVVTSSPNITTATERSQDHVVRQVVSQMQELSFPKSHETWVGGSRRLASRPLFHAQEKVDRRSCGVWRMSRGRRRSAGAAATPRDLRPRHDPALCSAERAAGGRRHRAAGPTAHLRDRRSRDAWWRDTDRQHLAPARRAECYVTVKTSDTPESAIGWDTSRPTAPRGSS